MIGVTLKGVVMARDRFVNWQGAAPESSAVEEFLRSFFQDKGTVEWVDESGRWQCTFPPNPSIERKAWHNERRFLEVFIDDDNIDVITRQQDEEVASFADEFARRCAERWNGRLEGA